MGHERFADNFFFSHMVGRTIESMVCLMVYLCGGIMEKHPNLKIICLETGASQMPWWLSRMDEHFEKLPHLVPWQKRKPIGYFQRKRLRRLRAIRRRPVRMGGGVFGRRSARAGDRFAALGFVGAGAGDRSGGKSTKISQENKRKVLGENAINLLGLGL